MVDNLSPGGLPDFYSTNQQAQQTKAKNKANPPTPKIPGWAKGKLSKSKIDPTYQAVQKLQDSNKTAEGRASTINTAASQLLASKPPTQQRPIDPLLSQLQFFQLVMPFLQQTIQQATSGLQSTAQQYQSDMAGLNLPDEIYGGVANNVASALNNQASAGAQSALAMPEYSFMMNLVEQLRQQQEANYQLQQQLAFGQQKSQGDDSLTALIASFLQPK